MARQLEPLLGRWATWFFAIGFMAAGVTSAMTAPLAAAYATCGALGWPASLSGWPFRCVWGAVLVAGVAFAVGAKGAPEEAIIFAQAANGIILPVIAVFLLLVVNRRALMGRAANRLASNALGALVVLAAAGLGVWKLWQLWQKLSAS